MENIKIEEVQRKDRLLKKPVSVRITESESKFLKQNNISPTALFRKVIERLMEKAKEKAK